VTNEESNTISSFCGKVKKTAFQTWIAYSDATLGFNAASDGKIDEALEYLKNLSSLCVTGEKISEPVRGISFRRSFISY